MNISDKLKALTKVGIEFEFYSDLPRKHIVGMLSKLLNIEIAVTNKHHDKNLGLVWKLEPDYSGGKNMSELITPPLSYQEAITVLPKILNWIDTYGWTDNKSALHFSISIEGLSNGRVLKMQDIDCVKLVSWIDEDLIYSLFPHRKNNVYCQSVKTLIPKNIFGYGYNFNPNDKNSFGFPNDKYRGINFSKLDFGYLEFRYVGGLDYQKKNKELLELLENWTITLAACFENSPFFLDRPSNSHWIMKQMYSWREIADKMEKYSDFIKNYPNIVISIDGNNDYNVVNSYWSIFKRQIFDILNSSEKANKCEMNWNTQRQRLQVSNFSIDSESILTDFDFVDCKIMSKFNRCTFLSCELKGSITDNSSSGGDNIFKNSKIERTDLDDSDDCSECYINGEDNGIRGKLTKCIIRSGYLETEDLTNCDIVEVHKNSTYQVE